MLALFSFVTKPFIDFAMAASAPVIQPVGNANTGGATATGVINNLYTQIFTILTLVAGILAVLYIVWAGIQYISSGGNADKAKTARNTIVNAIIGIVIIGATYVIIRLAVGLGSETAANNPGTATGDASRVAHYQNCLKMEQNGQSGTATFRANCVINDDYLTCKNDAQSSSCPNRNHFVNNCSNYETATGISLKHISPDPCTYTPTSGGNTATNSGNGNTGTGTTGSGGATQPNPATTTGAVGTTVAGPIDTDNTITTLYPGQTAAFATRQTSNNRDIRFDTSIYNSKTGVYGDGSVHVFVNNSGGSGGEFTIEPNGIVDRASTYQYQDTPPPSTYPTPPANGQASGKTLRLIYGNNYTIYSTVHTAGTGENKAYIKHGTNLTVLLPNANGTLTFLSGVNGSKTVAIVDSNGNITYPATATGGGTSGGGSGSANGGATGNGGGATETASHICTTGSDGNGSWSDTEGTCSCLDPADTSDNPTAYANTSCTVDTGAAVGSVDDNSASLSTNPAPAAADTHICTTGSDGNGSWSDTEGTCICTDQSNFSGEETALANTSCTVDTGAAVGSVDDNSATVDTGNTPQTPSSGGTQICTTDATGKGTWNTGGSCYCEDSEGSGDIYSNTTCDAQGGAVDGALPGVSATDPGASGNTGANECWTQYYDTNGNCITDLSTYDPFGNNQSSSSTDTGSPDTSATTSSNNDCFVYDPQTNICYDPPF